MAELVTASQFQLVPDVGGAVSRGLQIGGQFQAIQTQRQAQAQAEQKQKFQRVAVNALKLQGLPVEAQIKELERQQTQTGLTGQVSPESQELLGLLREGKTEQANQFITKAVDIGQRLGVIEAPVTPSGFTSVKERGGLVTGIKGGVVQQIPTTPEVTAAMAREPAGISQVQSSKILPGGLVQIVRKDGTTEVLEAKAAEQALVKTAEIRGAELQGLRAGERGAAMEAQKQSIGAFKQLTGIRKNIRNMEEGIQLIDEGAETGPIIARFPSIKAASVKLDNVQARLGLDVIGNTTFGALSESELNFALSSALPKKLDAPELRGWLEEKRDVQRKLADYLNDAAIFLGTPGNTVADFLRQKKEQKRQQVPAIPSGVAGQPAGQQVGRFTVEVVQ